MDSRGERSPRCGRPQPKDSAMAFSWWRRFPDRDVRPARPVRAAGPRLRLELLETRQALATLAPPPPWAAPPFDHPSIVAQSPDPSVVVGASDPTTSVTARSPETGGDLRSVERHGR